MKPRKGPRISPQASRSSYWNWWRNIKMSSNVSGRTLAQTLKKMSHGSVEHDFNSQCPSGCHRNAKILKKKYINLKREVKKRVAEEKKSLYLTGGGPPPKKLLTQFDEKLLTVLHEKQVSGMQSVYDNDVIAGNIDESVILEEETLESIMDFEKSTEVENYEGINGKKC
ncbi:uncharacterized protein LOC125779516 [Bactrocera dorsalis]|uniref:Regulatory protein zeste n=1 Tax=Bactrocera dorsalis TaxID=27457 RepID=A0ABM3K5S9_BACDO|nr:uncharacterized protein LOC125779516 [Bactrocera dorsalis]